MKGELNVSDGQPQVFIVGKAPNQRGIAFRRRAPVRNSGPGVVWLSGYRSDMDSTKATALDSEAERRGLGCLPNSIIRAMGAPMGWGNSGAISSWLEEALALIRTESEGPQILIGSSMGGWLALLAARALSEAGETERIKGLILIAPAVDFTEALVWAKAPEGGAACDHGGRRMAQAVRLFKQTDCLTRGLIEDGRKHLMLGGMIRIRAPVMVLQGMRDEDVPFLSRAGADAEASRSGDADAGQGRRSPAVTAARLAVYVRRAGKDGGLVARTRVARVLIPESLILSPMSPSNLLRTRAVDLEPDLRPGPFRGAAGARASRTGLNNSCGRYAPPHARRDNRARTAGRGSGARRSIRPTCRRARAPAAHSIAQHDTARLRLRSASHVAQPPPRGPCAPRA